jgi:beta-aspartyl-peptidase (threonine type)
MDGSTLDLGAIISVQGIANPITLARLVMTETPHKILAGEGAREFAISQGIPLVSTAELATPKTRARYEQHKAGTPVSPEEPRGTVGAVAVDAHGHIAAATSTGGVSYKLPGRVGDSPLVGSGAYVDDRTGAASATGDGEQIMRVVLCKTATDAIGGGMDAQAAADYAIRVMVERVNGLGGLIVVDHNGNVGFAHSDRNIATAWITAADGVMHWAISKA